MCSCVVKRNSSGVSLATSCVSVAVLAVGFVLFGVGLDGEESRINTTPVVLLHGVKELLISLRMGCKLSVWCVCHIKAGVTNSNTHCGHRLKHGENSWANIEICCRLPSDRSVKVLIWIQTMYASTLNIGQANHNTV